MDLPSLITNTGPLREVTLYTKEGTPIVFEEWVFTYRLSNSKLRQEFHLVSKIKEVDLIIPVS